MKVKHLIEKLSHFNAEAEVVFDDDHGYSYEVDVMEYKKPFDVRDCVLMVTIEKEKE